MVHEVLGHPRKARAIGVMLSLLSSLWAATTRAQDAGAGDASGSDIGVDGGHASGVGGAAAGSDAGAGGKNGDRVAAELVFPAPGATGVVLNTGISVRIERASLPPEPPSYAAGLLLQDEAGTLVPLDEIGAVETPRPYIGFDGPRLPNAQVEISVPPLALAPNRRYEVLSRLASCAAEADSRVACLSGAYAAIGEFTTGSERDTQAPVISSALLGPSPGACLVSLTLEATDDHAAANALRFRASASERGFLGPSPVLPAPFVSSQETRTTLAIVPIDPSGNQGAAFEVEVDACHRIVEDDFGDFEAPVETPVPVVTHDRGCDIAGGGARGSLAQLGVGLLALGVLTRKRRRVPARARFAPLRPRGARVPADERHRNARGARG